MLSILPLTQPYMYSKISRLARTANSSSLSMRLGQSSMPFGATVSLSASIRSFQGRNIR